MPGRVHAASDTYPAPWAPPTTQDSMLDTWHEYNRECTSYAAWMLHSVNGFEMPFNDDAYLWGTDATAAGITVDSNPTVGSIFWSSTHDHVAYVEAVSADKSTITTEDYNAGYPTNPGWWAEHTGVSASSATGYIHFQDISFQESSNSGVAVTDTAAPTVGFTQVFTEGPSNSLTTRWEVPGSTTWSSSTVGASSGTTYSPASVTVTQTAQKYGTSTTDAGLTQVFVQGPNNSLVTYWQTPGVSTTWSGPLTIAGANTTYSAPAAVVNQTTGLTQVFAEGPSNTLDAYWANVGQTWSGNTPGLANTTYSAPSATVTEAATSGTPAGFTQVFAQGPSNSLATYWETPGVSTTWSSGTVGASSGTTYSAPAAVVTQKDTSYTTKGFTHVFAQGPSNNLLEYWANPGTTSFSSGTAATGGIYCDATDINCGPTATVTELTTSNTPGGFTQVFTKGSSNALNTYWETPGHTSWSGTSIAGSGTTATNPAGVVTQTTKYTPAGFTHVFTEDTSNGLEDFWETPGPGASWSSGAPGGSGTTYSAP